MVEYLGPSWLAEFCEKQAITMFDRVTAIRLEYLSQTDIGLDEKTASLLKNLELVSARGQRPVKLTFAQVPLE